MTSPRPLGQCVGYPVAGTAALGFVTYAAMPHQWVGGPFLVGF